MRKFSFFIIIFTFCDCAKQLAIESNKQYVFLLNDSNEESRFYFNESVKKTYKEGVFINSPLVAIDGVIFNYKKSLDTIILPLKKKDITNTQLLGKDGSSVIYGKEGKNGAIIINTTQLKYD